jgi:hypothetical protein
MASATGIILQYYRPKNRKAGLDRPLKVGGGIQPLLVTVLTPATTCAVDCILFKMISWSIGERGYLLSKTIVFKKNVECRSVSSMLAINLARKIEFSWPIVITQNHRKLDTPTCFS